MPQAVALGAAKRGWAIFAIFTEIPLFNFHHRLCIIFFRIHTFRFICSAYRTIRFDVHIYSLSTVSKKYATHRALHSHELQIHLGICGAKRTRSNSCTSPFMGVDCGRRHFVGVHMPLSGGAFRWLTGLACVSFSSRFVDKL